VSDYYNIIKRPLITEKASDKKSTENQVVFEVNPKANRAEIKKAVEKIFEVSVKKVNTMNYPGKKKRMGRSLGRRPAWKKAYVTLKENETIEFFEGV
jgi:large subunit ribosomal protein L23